MAKNPIKFSEQDMSNQSFDEETNVHAREILGYDGSPNPVKQQADDVQTKVVESGGYTYVCIAAVGTAEATAGWKIYRVDASGNKMYADADYNYDNVATAPETLTYAYSNS